MLCLCQKYKWLLFIIPNSLLQMMLPIRSSLLPTVILRGRRKQLPRRLRQEDHLSPGVQSQAGQHSKTPSLKKGHIPFLKQLTRICRSGESMLRVHVQKPRNSEFISSCILSLWISKVSLTVAPLYNQTLLCFVFLQSSD